MKRQRTLLGVWAHPDDEAYLSAGLMAEARRNGERVVVLTATLGEHGTSEPRRFPPACLRRLRHHELRKSLAAVGVDELRIIGFEDGTCHEREGTAAVADHIADVAPDRIVTFGPDGITGHLDHCAVSRWTTDAWSAVRPEAALWYATKTPEFHREFAEVNEAIGLWNEQPEPPCTPEHECQSLTLDAASARSKDRCAPCARLSDAPTHRDDGPRPVPSVGQDRVVPCRRALTVTDPRCCRRGSVSRTPRRVVRAPSTRSYSSQSSWVPPAAENTSRSTRAQPIGVDVGVGIVRPDDLGRALDGNPLPACLEGDVDLGPRPQVRELRSSVGHERDDLRACQRMLHHPRVHERRLDRAVCAQR